ESGLVAKVEGIPVNIKEVFVLIAFGGPWHPCRAEKQHQFAHLGRSDLEPVCQLGHRHDVALAQVPHERQQHDHPICSGHSVLGCLHWLARPFLTHWASPAVCCSLPGDPVWASAIACSASVTSDRSSTGETTATSGPY